MAHSTSCSRRQVASITIMLLCAASGVARGQVGNPDTRSATGRPDSGARTVNTARERLLLNARLAQSFRVADLDGDGIQDIAFADFLADLVLLRFGDADGRFSRSIVLPAPGGPRSIVAVDLDKDGVIDLAVAGFFSGAVRIFRGRGNGQFNAPELVAVAPGLTGLTAADYDGDGAVDLATANVLSGAVTLLKRGPNQWMHVPLGRSTSPTLLLTGDIGGDGAPDLVAVDADGSANHLFPSGRLGAFNQRDPAGVVETLLADVAHQRGQIETNAQRVGQTTSGDGQVAAAGSVSPEWLSVQVRDRAGAARPGETVFFTRVAGMAELMDATGNEARPSDVRITDEQGGAAAQVLLAPLPGVNVFAATFPREYTATFGVISFVKYEAVVEAIVDALAREIRDPGTYAAHVALLSRALEFIGASDPVAAVREVVTSAELLRRTGSTASADARTTAAGDLERRMIDQILLAGISPQVAENQPILCDVPIRTTIAAATEVDRFTFNGVALEILHISVANEGGTNFNPVVTLIGPGGPVLSCTTITSNADCTLPASGAYTIQVVDGLSNGTGTYSVHLQRLTAGRRCGGSIACDVPVTSTLGTAARADTNLRSFSAAANERVHVSIGNQGGTNFNPFFRVIAPTGAVVAGCSFNASNVDCLLPFTGSYAVEVLDGSFDGTGTYSLHIQRLTAGFRCGGTIACDVSVTTTLGTAARADTNLHSFSAAANERMHVSIANQGGTNFNPFFRVIAPTGAVVAGCSFNASNVDCLLPFTGSYAVEVLDGSFDGTGTYSLHIQRLTAGFRCGGTIACDVPVTTTLGTAARADTNLHSFSAAANERLHVSIANQGGTNFNPFFRVIAPTGAVVAGCSFNASNVDCLLPVAGTYAVEVLDGSFDGTGTYSLHIQRLTAGFRCGGAIACDVPVTTTLGTAARADTNLHSFSAAANERMHVSIANQGGTNFNPFFRVIAPTGAVVAGCSFNASNVDCLLPVAGTYAVEVLDGSFDGTGTYSLHIQRLTAGFRCGGAIACDVPVTTTLGTAARADTNLHSFSAAANERMHVSIANQGGTNFNPFFRVIAPTGAVVAGCSFNASNVDCLLPVAGSYAVEVLDGSFDGTGTYSLHIQRLTAAFRCGGQARCGGTLTPAALGAVAHADSDLWSFGGVIGSVNIAFTNLGGTAFNPLWRVVSPTGTTVSGCSFSARTLATCALPSAGSYAVEVLDSSFDGTGRYALTVSGPGCRGLPNLTVSSLACGVRTAPGRTITVSVRTANTGDAAAPASQTGIYLSVNNTFGGDTALLPKISVPALAAGASALAAVAVTIPVATAPGEDFIIALADDRQVTPEGSERNNARACPLTVGPDLLISSIVAPASAVRGTAVVAAITVRNDGGATAAASVLRLHFSPDNVLSADDRFVAVNVPSLAANTATTVNATITIPASAAIGTRFFIGAADVSSVVKESDEANNRLARSIVVQ